MGSILLNNALILNQDFSSVNTIYYEIKSFSIRKAMIAMKQYQGDRAQGFSRTQTTTDTSKKKSDVGTLHVKGGNKPFDFIKQSAREAEKTLTQQPGIQGTEDTSKKKLDGGRLFLTGEKEERQDSLERQKELEISTGNSRRNFDASKRLWEEMDAKEKRNILAKDAEGRIAKQTERSDVEISKDNSTPKADLRGQPSNDVKPTRDKLARAAELRRDNPKVWSDVKNSEDNSTSNADISGQPSNDVKVDPELLAQAAISRQNNGNKEAILPSKTIYQTPESTSQKNTPNAYQKSLDMPGSHAATEKTQNIKERSDSNHINPVKENKVRFAFKTNIKVSDKNKSISEEKFLGNGDDHSQHDVHNANFEKVSPKFKQTSDDLNLDKAHPANTDHTNRNAVKKSHIDDIHDKLEFLPEIPTREHADTKSHTDDIYVIAKFIHQIPTREDRESLLHKMPTRAVVSIRRHLINGISNTEKYKEYVEASDQSQKASDGVKKHLKITEDAYKEPSLDMEDVVEGAKAARSNRQEQRERKPLTEEAQNRVSDAKYKIHIHEVAEILRNVETLKDSIIAVRSARQEHQTQATDQTRDSIEIVEDHSPTQRVMQSEIPKEENEGLQPLSEQIHTFEDQDDIDTEDGSSSIGKEEIKPHIEIQNKTPIYFIVDMYKKEKIHIEQNLKNFSQELQRLVGDEYKNLCKKSDYNNEIEDFEKQRTTLMQQNLQLEATMGDLDISNENLEKASKKLEDAIERLKTAIEPIKGQDKRLQPSNSQDKKAQPSKDQDKKAQGQGKKPPRREASSVGSGESVGEATAQALEKLGNAGDQATSVVLQDAIRDNSGRVSKEARVRATVRG